MDTDDRRTPWRTAAFLSPREPIEELPSISPVGQDSASAIWDRGLRNGRLIADRGLELPGALDPERPFDRGMVHGWRERNAQRAEPLPEGCYDAVWGQQVDELPTKA